MTDWSAIERAQAAVLTTRDAYDTALRYRGMLARQLNADGVTIYAIAQRLGVTQATVRKMLGL